MALAEQKRPRSPERIQRDLSFITRWAAQAAQKRAAQRPPTPGAEAHTPEQTRAEEIEHLKTAARAAFMSHPAATEADFERCWPSILDQMLVQHTLKVMAATLAVDEELTDMEAAFRMFAMEKASP